jgi:quinoprotein glucose dehydrogenase
MRARRLSGFSFTALASIATAIACTPSFRDPGHAEHGTPRQAHGWEHYGGDAGGQRYVPFAALTPANVDQLEPAWTYHTGETREAYPDLPSEIAFEGTPILVDGRLVSCTPMNRVIALDPVTGAELWRFDPRIDLTRRYANQLVCRGVVAWRDPERSTGEACATRIFTATNDARLFAIDAATGEPCGDFAGGRFADLDAGVGEQRWKGEYQVTSAPVVARGRVVVGSAVSDNDRVHAPSGVIRAYDARTGALDWAFDLAPPGFDRGRARQTGGVSDEGYALGTPNVWAPFSVDEERGLVFAPTGNPSPDYYRGAHPEMDYYGSSVVALQAETGSVAWHFQTVHHDLWDFDVPAQPTLTTVAIEGTPRDAVVQGTKMGLIFVLDRETGEPLFPVEERPVPTDGAPGEQLSPTQPFPTRPPPLVRHGLDEDDAWGLLGFDRRACRQRIRELRTGPIYTAPGVAGTVAYPGNAGGVNWGGVAVDPERQILISNVIDLPWVIELIPRADFERVRAENPGVEMAPQTGTPFGLRREIFLSSLGLPCTKPPWGKLVAVDLGSGEILWERPLGTVTDVVPGIALHWELGVPGLGGPLVTAGGLVFIGAAMDDYLRAFDLQTGSELWRARLPAGGQATPMSYSAEGRQYVVIAAGGHERSGTRQGDAIVAFALPD